MSVPLKINNKDLLTICEPALAGFTGDRVAKMLELQLVPTSMHNTAETYSRDADRTANYELEELKLVNRKAKPEFTWSLIKQEYVTRILQECGYSVNYKNPTTNEIMITDAPVISITFRDFTGPRTIRTYLGQTIEGELVEYNNIMYWQDFRIAFPER